MLYLGPYRHPGWLSPGFAILLFAFGLAAFSTGEFVREAVRKPYIVYNAVLGNQLLVEEVPAVRQRGVLESGTWTKALVAARYPQVMRDGQIDATKLPGLPDTDRRYLGEVIFTYQCGNCHATTAGYSAISHLTQGWTRTLIREVVDRTGEVNFFMPPWTGTPEEADLLTAYLASIAHPRPSGMEPGPGR
jgi:mono/diheme cytochrome c family protein